MTGFRQYLASDLRLRTRKERFAITGIGSTRSSGWHDPAGAPLGVMRFSQIANKAFDEVFVQFGCSLKPDLIVAQLNHLGDFIVSGDGAVSSPVSYGKGRGLSLV